METCFVLFPCLIAISMFAMRSPNNAYQVIVYDVLIVAETFRCKLSRIN